MKTRIHAMKFHAQAFITLCLATPVLAIQTAVPTSTVQPATWTANGAASQHLCLDEASQDGDTSYVEAIDDFVGNELIVGLTALTDPASSASHVIDVYAKAVGSKNPGETFDVSLYEGTTLIAAFTGNSLNRAPYQFFTFTLSAAQADSITDYSTLRLQFAAGGVKEGDDFVRVTWAQFTCPDPAAAVAPTVGSPSFNTIDTTTANMGGTISDTGGNNPSEVGIFWDTTSGFTAPAGTKASSNGNFGAVAFTVSETGLPSGTEIFFQAFATNSAGYGFSSESSFFTEPTQAAITSIDQVTNTSFRVNWTDGTGDGTLVLVSSNAITQAPTDGTLHAANAAFGSGANLGSSEYVVFRGAANSVTVTGLTPGQQYFVAVFQYAGTTAGASGINYQQTTPDTANATCPVVISAPTVTTPTFTAIDSATATLGGNVTATNHGTVTERGAYWDTTSGFTAPAGTKDASAASAGNGVFTEGVTALPSGTEIFFQAFAANSAGEGYSTEASFFTEPTQASGAGIDQVTNTSFRVNWTPGNGTGTLVIIKQTNAVSQVPADGTIYSADTVYGSGTDLGGGEFVIFATNGSSVTVTGLTPGETYHVAIYQYAGQAAGASGINYQQTSPQTANATCPIPTAAPTINTPTFANIDTTTANLGGNIAATNNSSVTERGVYWDTASGFTAPAGTKSSSNGNFGVGAFVNTVGGLPTGTEIFFQAFALNGVGESYTVEASFFTEPTQATITSIDQVTNTSFRVNWTDGTGDGTLVLVSSNAITQAPTDGTLHAANAAFGSGANLGSSEYVVFRGAANSVTVTGLTPGQQYFVAVFQYAGTAAGASGINYQQTAPDTANATCPIFVGPPTVNTPTFTSIDTTTATLGGNIAATNGQSVTERGVFWDTASGFTAPAGTKDSTGGGNYGNGVFTEGVTALPSGTEIFFQAFASNASGYGFSGEASFFTEPTQASITSIDQVTNTSFRVNWTDGTGDGTLVLVSSNAITQAPTDGTLHAANAAFGSGANLGSSEYVVFRGAANSVTVTGLTPGEQYFVAVFQYAGTVAGASGINYQQDTPDTANATCPISVLPPSIANPSVANVNTTSADLGGEITDTNSASVTERGIYWDTTSGFTAPAGTKVSETGNFGDGTFSVNVTGLSSADEIFFQAFAVNSGGTTYGVEESFWTEPTQASNVQFSNVTNTSMTVSWTAGNGAGAIVVMKAGGAVTQDPVDGSLHFASTTFGSGQDLGGGEYVVFRAAGTSVNVVGLTAGVTYHVAVFEYAGSGSGVSGINYQQDGPPTGSQATPALPSNPPTVNTPTAPFSGIETTSAELGANVASDGDTGLDERGTTWATSPNPTANRQNHYLTETGVFSHVHGGMSPGTLYYMRGYASNSAGVAYSSQLQFYTEPNQAINLAFSAVTNTSMTISWNNNGGAGAIVVMKLGGVVGASPDDGTEHSASSTFGLGANLGNSCYVVYRGAGTSVNVSGLAANSLYHVAVFEYAGSGALINYQQSSPLAGAQTTALDVPGFIGHNAANNIQDCNTCHAFHGTFGVARYNEQANVCFTCHNPTGVASNKSEVNVHVVTGGSITNVDCGSCHDVHNTSPAPKGMITYNAWTGETRTNMAYFRIDTNYVPQALPTGVLHTTPFDFAFTNATGPYNGACQACHQNTGHHTQGGLDVGHYAGQDCTGCHGHDGGFLPSGGGDCLGCHSSPQGPRRAVVGEFSLSSHHVIGGAVTTGDCAVCHYEARDATYHMNNQVDLIDPDNVSVGALIQFTQFTRNRSTDVLESWVTDVQNNFCFGCHDANGASDPAVYTGTTGGSALQPFSSNSRNAPNVWAAFDPANSYHHAVRDTVGNSICDVNTMEPPWNQDGSPDLISCFDCHETSGHGNANNYMLRVNISGPTDGGNIVTFCTLCHDYNTYMVDDTNSGMPDHDRGQHIWPDNQYACRGCHAGQVDDDGNGSCDNGAANPQIGIHGGNFTWPGCSKSPSQTAVTFLFGGWLNGSDNNECWGGACNHSNSSKTF